MAFPVYKDRVKDTTTTTGTGTVTLAGSPPTGFRAFSAFTNGDKLHYCIAGGSEWEVGLGTYSSTGPTLSRDTVLASSNAGAAVSFSAGTKDVFADAPATLFSYPSANGKVRRSDDSQSSGYVWGSVDEAQLPISGTYYAPFHNSTTGLVLATTRKYFVPLFLPAGTYTKLACRANTAVVSTNVRLSLYNRTAAGLPGTLVSGADSGSVSANVSGTLIGSTGLSIAVPKDGYYFVCLHADGVPNIRAAQTSGQGPGLMGCDFSAGANMAAHACYRDTTYGAPGDETGNSFTMIYTGTAYPIAGIAA